MDMSMEEELNLPLSEFVKLPTTVDFQVLATDRFKAFARNRPYIRLGTEFSNSYIVGYINQSYVTQLLNELGNDFLYFLPRIMSPTDSQSNDASGITQVLNQPFLNLSGRGVIIGIVDTGIDYRNDAFKFEDGSTKILGIWDQTVDGNREEGLYFGSTYTSDDINNANRSDTPYSIVPSIDEDGHGTFLASVAASNETGEFIGAAPKAYLLVVKLKRASQFLIDRYLVSNDNPNLYESTDYMLGMKYIVDATERLNMPLVIEPSRIFGESFACAGIEVLPVNVVASEDTDVLLIDARRITQSCSNSCSFHSRMIFNLLNIVARKNLVFHQKIEITSKRSTREKLMTYLLLEAKKNGSNTFTIPYDRQELADYLEVERSGLSAEISKMKKEKMLESHRCTFSLL